MLLPTKYNHEKVCTAYNIYFGSEMQCCAINFFMMSDPVINDTNLSLFELLDNSFTYFGHMQFNTL